MPIQWNLRQWLATNRQIYRPAELQALLEEKTGVQLSWQAISSLLNNVPSGLRFSTIQALCNALNCNLSDFCDILPDQQPATISVLIPAWVWSISPDLTRGIIDAITASSYDISLYSISDNENPRSADHALIERFLATPLSAGLVAVFPGRLSVQLTQLARRSFPVVAIDDQEMQVVPVIGVDNTTGAYLAVRHLLQLGHRRIAHIKGPAEYLVSAARYQGYCRALLEAGLLPDPELVLEGDFLPPSGRACANQLFALPPARRPTAIFAASDQMAYGVIAAAEDAGLSIPKDIALVGFDDDQPSAYTRPPLTTVRQPYFEMGQQAVALLLSLLDTPATRQDALVPELKKGLVVPENSALLAQHSPVQVQLQASLVVRQSCGAQAHQVPIPSSNSTLP